jgi:sigma-B regulation protein RsbU (phosphoserine phosphatase)
VSEGNGVLAPGTGADDAFYSALLDDDPDELYENAPCAYLSALPDGTIAKVNATFVTWTGHDRAAVIGRRRFQDLLPPGDRIFYETHIAPLLRMQGHVREIAVELVCEGGARLPVIINAAAKTDDAGAPVVVRVALFDATERRRYEQELLEQRRRAEASDERATALARTLQQSLLPPALIEIPGLDVAGGYRPAGDGSEVGGDFYDVFETGQGTWGVVLGDVVGKGAAAATLTALVRYTVRAEASRSRSPRDVLTRVHEQLVRFDPDRYCTAIYGVLDRTGDGLRLTVGAGGHHLPLLVHADGTVTTIGCAGTIIGMLAEPTIVDDSVELVPGDTVVLYTDGVVEARRDGRFLEVDGLRALVASRPWDSAAALVDAVVDAALDFQDGDAADDIAVLAMRVL